MGIEERAVGVNRGQSEAFREAMAAIEQGDPVAAVETMRAAAERAAELAGEGAADHLALLIETATVHAALREPNHATEVLRRAAAIEPDPADPQATRERLTCLMNLGSFLQILERHDEAENVLLQGVHERRAFYGEDHPGFGFGLEPLAELYLALRRHEDALQVADAAVDNFSRVEHPRVVTALALRAEIVAAAGIDAEPLHEIVRELPDELLEELVGHVASRLDVQAAPRHERVMEALLPLVDERLGRAHPAAVHLRTTLANVHRFTNRHEDRVRLVEELLRVAHEQNDGPMTVQTLMGLSLACEEAGYRHESIQALEAAVRLAREIDEPRWIALATRNLAVAYNDANRPAEAERVCREALAAAERAADRELLGRVHAALGVLLQHLGRADEAHPHLRAAAAQLPHAHPDRAVALAHAEAAARGQRCACGDERKIALESLRAEILRRVPPGLLDDVTIAIGPDGQPDIETHPARDLSPDETRDLDRILHHAFHDFQRRVQAGEY